MKPSKCGAAAAAATLFVFAPVFAGCGSSDPATVAPSPTSPPARRAPIRAPGGGASRQEAFLARIKAAAHANGVVRQARMNGDSELGIVLGQNVKLRQIKPLMTTLLREMRDEFPGRALAVIAYAPNGRTLATLRYNPNAPASANVTFAPAPGLN